MMKFNNYLPKAAMLVMCALGVSALPGAEPSIIPFNPIHGQLSTETRLNLVGCLPCEAKKPANDAPAGPVPIMRRSVTTVSGPSSPFSLL